ncbi:hypothetical protein BHM03_00058432 [Ensete ventricosum]|nr:hypothetical protein BHM03_00058432 [Ensete ventricosum]
MGMSWISWIKGEPQRELSPRSSFILMVLWMSSILWFTRRSCALRESLESEKSISRSLGLWARLLGELRNVGDDHLKHPRYGLDLVGKSLKGLRGYCRDPEIKWGALSILTISYPPSSTKMLLGDPSCPRSQHDVVRPTRTGTTQQDSELGEDVRHPLGLEVF